MELERVQTGVSGLDRALHGGLLANRIYLVRGSYGTGKTTLGLQFLLEGLKKDERVLYITLSEPKRDIIENAKSFGWDLSGIGFLELTPGKEFFLEGQGYDVFSPSEVEGERTASEIASAIESSSPKRIVFDSVSELKLLTSDTFQYRRQLIALMEYLRDHGSTTLLLSEFTPESTDEDMDAAFLSHGVITLRRDFSTGGREKRTVEIEKFRGSPFRSGRHDVQLSGEGLSVHPRLVVAEHKKEFAPGIVSSGIPGVDEMLTGGLDKGTCTMFSGHTGIGKTTMAMAFVKETAGRGQRCVFYSFEESIESIIHRCESVNIPARDMEERGGLKLIKINPIELSADQFAEMLHEEVSENDTSLVVIDSIAGYMASIDTEQHVVQYLHNLVSYLNNMGVTSILTNELTNITGTFSPTEMGVSYLADTIVLMRYIELQGRLRKTISVLKKRLTAHKEQLRELTITPYGLNVGEPLDGLRGVLTGTPTLLEEQHGIGGHGR